MAKSCATASNMVYSPNTHTPIGTAVLRPDGSHVLRIKNERTKKYDDFPIDRLMTEVIQKAIPDIQQRPAR